jgi:hypothetical protein
MSIREVICAALGGLALNEICDVSPWLAIRLVRWSARRRYANPTRAQVRAEELAALINDRPGKLFKLITAAMFAGSATIVAGRRVLDNALGRARLPVNTHLTSTETLHGQWRRHWVHFLKEFAIGAATTLAAPYPVATFAHRGRWALAVAVVALWAATLLWVAWRALVWDRNRLMLTDQRLMLVHGVVRQRLDMVALNDIVDMTYVQSPVARALHYAAFEVDTGHDHTRYRVRHLPNPERLSTHVAGVLAESRRRGNRS